MSLEDLRKRLRQNQRSRRATQSEIQAVDEQAAELAPAPEAKASFSTAVKNARQAQERVLTPPENDGAAAAIAALSQTDPAIALELQQLDAWQLAAVLNDAPALLLRAQVGSGKTRVLVARVLKALATTKDSSRPILVMTFTNRAAQEIRERVRARAGAAALNPKLRIGTFHSLCVGLLREQVPAADAGRTAKFRLLNERARLQLLREIIATEHLRIAYASKLERRLELHRAGEPRFGNMKRDDDIATLSRSYEAAKQSRDLVDFDDLIDLGRRAALMIPATERPSHMIVDEFQDTDPAQLALLQAWHGTATQIFAVGDPDQVIYSWRGGSRSVFDDFQERFEAATYSLPRNYRSTATILEAARFLLGPVAGCHQLHAARPDGEGIQILRHHDVVAEAQHIARELPELTGKSVAILVRTREQMPALSDQLDQLGVDLRVHEAKPTEDSLREWLFDYLSFLGFGLPADAAARVLGHRQFGFEGLKGRKLSTEDTADCRELLSRWFGDDQQGADFLAGIVDRARLALPARQLSAEAASRALELDFFLEPRSSRFESRRRRVLAWLEGLNWPSDTWATELMDQLKLAARNTSSAMPPAQIELMTMHAAKGLEFDCVFLSGVNRGMVPLAASWGDPEKEAEERRLLFVAMTRARDRLEIGWSATPPRSTASAEPSAWLSLIPDRLIATTHCESTVAVAAPVSPFGAGVAVRHPRYGQGTVVATEKGQVRCVFGSRGEKSFFLAACPLEIIDD